MARREHLRPRKDLIMPLLFRQTSFDGGLNTQLAAEKSPDNAYPLLINGRTRRNVIAPTNRHLKLSGPEGNYQGLYVVGSFLLLFVSGIAYYADINNSPIIFIPVGNWTPLDANTPRIYAENAPQTTSRFNRTGTVDTSIKVFNNALAIFNQALYCFDGINPPQDVTPDGVALSLGSFATWTQDKPLYVPKGVLPAMVGSQLYLASPDRRSVFGSVPNRPSDFVINLTPSGDAGGDENTTSQAVSFNDITALRALSTGQLLVGTLYGTFALQFDPTITIFGVPYPNPVFLFPAGPLNELSVIDVLSDTAMITQSGIHSFNAVAQAKRESNNAPFGARIRGLLTNPENEKAIVQKDTCAGLYDDYVFFAVNTIFGYGALVFDTIAQSFQSLDLSFGQVKQFANTRLNGNERFFFITHNNEIFEAFADTRKNSTRILLGEWTPADVFHSIAAPSVGSDAQILSYMLHGIFANVRESGQVKLAIYADKKLKEEVVLQIDATKRSVTLPIPIPFVEGVQVAHAGFQFSKKSRSWKIAALIEWNFAAELTDVGVAGSIEASDNVRLDTPTTVSSEQVAFIAESGYPDELNPGGSFSGDHFVLVNVVKGIRYIYFANGNGPLVNGDRSITENTFIAAGDTVAIQGTGPMTFSLRTAENYLSVLGAINKEENLLGIIHGGGFAYSAGTKLDVEMAEVPILPPLGIACGAADVATNNGEFFFNLLGIPRYYPKTLKYLDFFFFNGETFEPDGTDALSIQVGMVKNWLAGSNNPYRFLVVNKAPWTNDITAYPGATTLRFLANLPGLSGILSGLGRNMERLIVDGFPFFVCGAGGQTLRDFRPGTSSAFRDNAHYGYLSITADALTCQLDYKDTTGAVLDTYAIYA